MSKNAQYFVQAADISSILCYPNAGVFHSTNKTNKLMIDGTDPSQWPAPLSCTVISSKFKVHRLSVNMFASEHCETFTAPGRFKVKN